MKKEKLPKGTSGKSPLRKDQQKVRQVKTNRYSALVGLGIIVVLGIIIYSNSFGCSFHFDDFYNIVDNASIRNLWNVKAWWNFVPARPIGNFTFALNYSFSQLDVRYYHLFNLTIHLINACLVWWLAQLIFSSPAMKDQPVSGYKKEIAFFTALLFISHPLATESVTYIVQRVASLVAMFYLLSVALYVKSRLFNNGNKSKYLLFAGSFISAVCAMLTKENAFTLPFAILLCEFFFLRTKKLSTNIKDWRVIAIIAVFLAVIIPLEFSFSIFKPIGPQQGNMYTVTPLNYLFTQFSVIVRYIRLLIFPVGQNFDYNWPVAGTFFGLRTIMRFLSLLILLLFAVILYKRSRVISFGILWFFLTLMIESSFIPIPNLIFEHRTYLPSFGYFLAVSSILFGLLWLRYKVFTIVIMVIMVISNSYLTFQRNKVWKDDLTLWTDVISKPPVKARAFYNRGVAYKKSGQFDNAIADYSKAIEINPTLSYAYYNRGACFKYLGQLDKALADDSKAIEIDPKYTDAYSNRGNVYEKLGQRDKAIADYSKAIEINPKFSLAWFNRAVTYGNLGEWDKAVADLSKAIEIDPDFKDAYSLREIAVKNQKRNEVMK